MSVLRALKKAVFGETWLLPIAVAILLGAAAVLKEVAPSLWDSAGGLFLLVGALVVLCALVRQPKSAS